jgi:hypothetical protein
VKVETRIKWSIGKRRTRYRALLDNISGAIDTGLSDETVLAILAAKHRPWSKAMTVNELLQNLGIEP